MYEIERFIDDNENQFEDFNKLAEYLIENLIRAIEKIVQEQKEKTNENKHNS